LCRFIVAAAAAAAAVAATTTAAHPVFTHCDGEFTGIIICIYNMWGGFEACTKMAVILGRIILKKA
jgi:hypothetical protein